MLGNINRYYVYAYLDPREAGKFTYLNIEFNYKPFYIGKGSGNRKNFHLWQAKVQLENDKSQVDTPCIEYCKEILKSGLEPIIVLIEIKLLEQEAYNLEHTLVIGFGRRDKEGGPLLNYHQGGNFGPHDYHSYQLKQTLSKNHYFNRKDYSLKDHWNYGKHLSQETRNKISKSHKGKKLSPSHKLAIKINSNAVSGDNHYSKQGLSENHKANLKLARFNLDKSRVSEIFNIMLLNNDTPHNNRFNKITYELARSKVFARRYPSWDKISKFFSEEEILAYFSNAILSK